MRMSAVFFGLVLLIVFALAGSARADWGQPCPGGRCGLAVVNYGQAVRVLTTADAPPPTVVVPPQRMPVANGPTVAFPPMVQTVEPPVAVRRVGLIRRLLFWRR